MSSWRLTLTFLGLLTGACAGDSTEGPPGIGTLGVECAPSGGYACEAVEQEPRELVCESGVFEVYSDCPGGCEVRATDDGARVLCGQHDTQAISAGIPAPSTDAGAADAGATPDDS